MLALVYLFLCFYIGTELVGLIFRKVKISKSISRWWIVASGGYLTGTILVTWVVYLIAYLLRDFQRPLWWADLIVMSAIVLLFFFRKPWRACGKMKVKKIHVDWWQLSLLLLILIITTWVMFDSFRIVDGWIQIGLSVFGDFGPHLAMIRSFSLGNNFPTGYPHFPDDQIRYHFMFQFLTGNLEYLGLRLDWAMNLPSVLSLSASLMLLYGLAVKLTGKKLVGFLVIIMFWFRSSYAFFSYAIKAGSLTSLWQNINNNRIYIGETPNESWGLWTLNVYANQRHFGMAIGVLFLVVMLMVDLIIEGERNRRGDIRNFLFCREAWLVKNYQRPIFVGVIVGLLTYWNAAVVIAAIIIFAGMAVLSKSRFEYVIALLVIICLGQMQKMFFIGSGDEGIQPEILIGFLAKENSFWGIWQYYGELLGVMIVVFIGGLFFGKVKSRMIGFVFLGPLLFATFVKLTPDIPVAHKYVMVSVILVNIIVASFLVRLFNSRKIIPIVIGVILLLEMTLTGIVDWVTFYNLNKSEVALKYAVDDEVTNWVHRNTNPDEVFLTDTYFLNSILLAGRKIFFGWPYYAWSAGYKTLEREGVVKDIYGGSEILTTRNLLKENKIDYVVIDDSNRFSLWHKVNEALFDRNFELIYSNTRQGNIKIYRTN